VTVILHDRFPVPVDRHPILEPLNSEPLNPMRRFIIPIFVPHLGCPHQCIFCNQRTISGVSHSMVTPDIVDKTVRLHLQTWGGREKLKTQIAFYGGSFSGLDPDVQESFLSKAHVFIKRGDVDSIRISTRPDYINPKIVGFLKDHGVETIELGVQSMADKVLRLSGRGHTSSHVRKAVKTLKDYEVEIGVQIMPGLPGDTPELIMDTVEMVIGLEPDFVRIYPTLVIKDTPLEELHSKGSFLPMTLDKAVDTCAKGLLKFQNAGIEVVRIGLQPTPELEEEGNIIAGPYHPSFRHLVESAVFFEMTIRLIKEADLNSLGQILTFKINPRDYSYFCGQKNNNLIKLKELHRVKDIKVTPETSVKRGSLELDMGGSVFHIRRRELTNPVHPV